MIIYIYVYIDYEYHMFALLRKLQKMFDQHPENSGIWHWLFSRNIWISTPQFESKSFLFAC